MMTVQIIFTKRENKNSLNETSKDDRNGLPIKAILSSTFIAIHS